MTCRAACLLAGAPNPAGGDVDRVHAPNREPATLELIDVTGRRVAERLDAFGPAATVNLTDGRRLSAGVWHACTRAAGTPARVSVIR